MPGKSRSRGRKFNLRPVRVSPTLALSTLGAATAIKTGLTGVATSPYRIISAKLTYNQLGLTPSEGPITVGLAHSDYTVAEIAEAIGSTASINPADMISRERAKRLVRVIGTFRSEANNDLRNGEPIKTRLNWAIPIGVEVSLFAFNTGSAVLTTGTIIACEGSLWVKDSV